MLLHLRSRGRRHRHRHLRGRLGWCGSHMRPASIRKFLCSRCRLVTRLCLVEGRPWRLGPRPSARALAVVAKTNLCRGPWRRPTFLPHRAPPLVWAMRAAQACRSQVALVTMAYRGPYCANIKNIRSLCIAREPLDVLCKCLPRKSSRGNVLSRESLSALLRL